jgi:hypothetical protein
VNGFPRIPLLIAASVIVTAGSVSSASAEGVCDPIVRASQLVTQQQLAFTQEAYADGQITPEEAATAEEFSRRIAQITADLDYCIRTGVVPAGYEGVPQPPALPPVTNTLDVEIGKWRIGDRAMRISWDTSTPTTMKLQFFRKTKVNPEGVLVGEITAGPETNSISFKGKLDGHKVKPGNYLVIATATDEAGNTSEPVTEKLKILPKNA